MRRSAAGFLEILLITSLLLLFGVTTYTLVSAGGRAYGRVMDKREDSVSLRVALSYLTTQLRQNDTDGAVLLREESCGECLVLRRRYDGETYETRIYLDDGRLWESFTPADMPFDPAAGDEITPLTGLSFRLIGPDRPALVLTVTAGEGDGAQTRQTVVTLNAPAGEQP